MKKISYSVVLFALIFALCVGAMGCSNEQQGSNISDIPLSITNTATDDVKLDNINLQLQDYELIEQDGEYYIVFDDMTLYDVPNDIGNVKFESFAEFKDTVTNGKLTAWQKRIIVTEFEKNDIGIRICDFNNLLEPHMPNDCKTSWVYWAGESYSFSISSSSGVFGFITKYPQSTYDKIFNREVEEVFNNTTIKVKETYETDDGKKVTVYITPTGSLRYIIYTIAYGEKNIVVKEEYWSSPNTVPTDIEMYCTESNAYYVVNLHGFVEKPSDEWLYEFGMEKVE